MSIKDFFLSIFKKKKDEPIKKEPTVKMSLGQLGEEAALEYLRGLGYFLLERNFRHGRSEIDIIMKDERCVVFCEVRTQDVNKENYLTPAESVTLKKRAVLSRGAAFYMGGYSETHPSNTAGYTIPPCRFDVIEVYVDNNQVKEINHIKDAFFKTRQKKGTGRNKWRH